MQCHEILYNNRVASIFVHREFSKFVPVVWDIVFRSFTEVFCPCVWWVKDISTLVLLEVQLFYLKCKTFFCTWFSRDFYLFPFCEISFTTSLSRDVTFVFNVWEIFLHSSTEMFAHQKSDGRDWNVRANMCHVQGMLKSDKKNVSWSCHRPYSPTAWEIGSSVSPSSLLGLMEVCFGAGPLGVVVSVIESVGEEVNMLSAL